MQDFTRRTLRTWAVAQAIYAVAVAVIVLAYIPWKTPLANVLALTYLALQATGSPGLWRGRRWGWRVSVFAGATGLIAMLFVCGALLTSWGSAPSFDEKSGRIWVQAKVSSPRSGDCSALQSSLPCSFS
jgi:hypothetical protein